MHFKLNVPYACHATYIFKSITVTIFEKLFILYKWGSGNWKLSKIFKNCNDQ